MLQFDHTYFLPIDDLVKKKKAAHTLISVVIPTLNEAETIGDVVGCAKNNLMNQAHLIDEIIVIDSNSTDATADNARAAGARVFSIDDINYPKKIGSGKGLALWKSLFVAQGDVIVCIDADIAHFKPHFIYGLIGPFLENSKTIFAKAFYDRPFILDNKTIENYGGRVTEILVRPMLSAFIPELAHIFQPLSGEYAFRRGPIENIPFSSGYGVEIGLIFDIFKKYGLESFAQVNMGTRMHRNRPVQQLGKMAFGILQTLFRKLEMMDALTLSKPLCDTMFSLEHGTVEQTIIQEIELPPKSQVWGVSVKNQEEKL
jgi:glucosyl-3-phosphoglycerate synthase